MKPAVHITKRYVKPVYYGVASVERWHGSVEAAVAEARRIMHADSNVYEAVVSVAFLDQKREAQMIAQDRALGLLPALEDEDGGS